MVSNLFFDVVKVKTSNMEGYHFSLNLVFNSSIIILKDKDLNLGVEIPCTN